MSLVSTRARFSFASPLLLFYRLGQGQNTPMKIPKLPLTITAILLTIIVCGAICYTSNPLLTEQPHPPTTETYLGWTITKAPDTDLWVAFKQDHQPIWCGTRADLIGNITEATRRLLG